MAGAGCPPEQAVISETGGTRAHLVAVREQEWKYVLTVPNGAAEPSEQLYDLRDEPREQRDVAAAHPEQLLRGRLNALDFVLQHRAGRTLLITGDGRRRSYRVEAEKPAAGVRLRRLAGVPAAAGTTAPALWQASCAEPLSCSLAWRARRPRPAWRYGSLMKSRAAPRASRQAARCPTSPGSCSDS